ncbi:NAD(P)/FAD-dependent oxidoreductase [Aminipila luticellarii]|uniref:NAD(P)/FAD-dependent oxidoreductase n=1 Tax=Aminipila luticellarii TaxID=2507160 RepID=A0A410PUB5_9FIRM|nr:NAD(P)/FAD-dependent oxidoreductase [Aminipila luticellarii]QAT42513.1 NAD(P)/FAD-dependent oxidoreductase [Aminipila luticellarii]
MKNVIIIGNGPAGISAALYTVRAGIHTTVIGSGLGSLGKADKIENYYGFEYPVSGTRLVETGIAQAKRLGAKVIKEEVVSVSSITAEPDSAPNGQTFSVRTDKHEYLSDSVILATGTSRTAPPIKGLQELEGKGVSYCAICDAFFYRGKNVGVLGNGEYALNEAKELLPVANSVTLLTNGTEPAVPFPQEIKIERQSVSSFNPGPSSPLLGGIGSLESVTLNHENQIRLDGVFIAYGTAGSTALAKKIGAFTEGNKIIVNADMSTNVPGLYAAGDCTGGLLQISKAVSDGAIAGTSAIKYLRG